MKKFFVLSLVAVLLLGCGKQAITENVVEKNTTVLDITANTETIFVYYSNERLAEEGNTDCSVVFPVERLIIKTDDPATAALEKLFLGPTPYEMANGYSSFFSYFTRDALKSVTVKDGTAYVNLTDLREVIPNASASCGSAAFLASMQRTLWQFPEITRVLFAIDGDLVAFYEWLQIGCTPENDNCDKMPYQSESEPIA